MYWMICRSKRGNPRRREEVPAGAMRRLQGCEAQKGRRLRRAMRFEGGLLSLSCGSHKVEPRASDIPCKRERGGEDYESVSRVKKRVETRELYLGSRQRRPIYRPQTAKLQKFPRRLLYVAPCTWTFGGMSLNSGPGRRTGVRTSPKGK
jgi:hypothetical protein